MKESHEKRQSEQGFHVSRPMVPKNARKCKILPPPGRNLFALGRV